MSPDNLIDDFGAGSQVYQQVVGCLYRTLWKAAGSDGDAAASFRQWQDLFGKTTGRDAGLNSLRDKPEVRAMAQQAAFEESSLDPPRLFFAVHTYYALLARLIAHRVSSPNFRYLLDLPGDKQLSELVQLEAGDSDLFSWYLELPSDEAADATRLLIDRVSDYDLRAACSGDVLKQLYHQIVPRLVRHDLGEYYTPDWLAEHVLDALGYDGQTDIRLLDPSCGSGTFLVLAIRRLRVRCESLGLSRTETLRTILRNVAGIDLNPLAVRAAQTNYLLALSDLLDDDTMIQVPVHLADAILNPEIAIGPRCGGFDIIAGNPPWVGWEALPKEYRKQTAELWIAYGLFPHGGMAAILGNGKKDLSMLMSYVVTDRLLVDGGRLGFVITQSAFKTSGAGQGFRRFQLGDGTPLCVELVDDLSDFQPFEQANNRTAVLVWTKNQRTEYPVTYRVWRKESRNRIEQRATLADVRANTRRLNFVADPVDPGDRTSAWFTASSGTFGALREMLGPSDYQAHEGVNSGGANAIYWLELVQRRGDGSCIVRNITRGAKRRVEQVEAEVEGDLLYPLLRGREVRRWRAEPSALILLAQDPAERRGIDEAAMRQQLPKTHAYLTRFERPLRARAAFRRYFTRQKDGNATETGPFYSMFNVGQYTLAKHKVVWHRMIAPIEAAVIGERNGKPILPQETHAFVACESADEAHYLAGMLNSTVFNFAAMAYSQAGGKSFGSPHLLEYLCVPKYDSTNSAHRDVARVAADVQSSIVNSDADVVAVKESCLNSAAAAVWEVPDLECFTARDPSKRL